MASFNQVVLMGNVTRDPEMKTLPNGNHTVADFGMAINRKYRTASGEDREEVCFIDCTVFGKQAEVLHQYCRKGKPLFVQGRLKYDTWEDKLGGKRSKVSVIVENFQFIGSRDGNASFEGAAAKEANSSTPWRTDLRRESTDTDASPKFSQSDIPF